MRTENIQIRVLICSVFTEVLQNPELIRDAFKFISDPHDAYRTELRLPNNYLYIKNMSKIRQVPKISKINPFWKEVKISNEWAGFEINPTITNFKLEATNDVDLIKKLSTSTAEEEEYKFALKLRIFPYGAFCLQYIFNFQHNSGLTTEDITHFCKNLLNEDSPVNFRFIHNGRTYDFNAYQLYEWVFKNVSDSLFKEKDIDFREPEIYLAYSVEEIEDVSANDIINLIQLEEHNGYSQKRVKKLINDYRLLTYQKEGDLLYVGEEGILIHTPKFPESYWDKKLFRQHIIDLVEFVLVQRCLFRGYSQTINEIIKKMVSKSAIDKLKFWEKSSLNKPLFFEQMVQLLNKEKLILKTKNFQPYNKIKSVLKLDENRQNLAENLSRSIELAKVYDKSLYNSVKDFLPFINSVVGITSGIPISIFKKDKSKEA